MDFLVTINSQTNGSLVAYEIPDDFRTGEYRRRVLATGYVPSSGVDAGAAPGMAFTFYPQVQFFVMYYQTWQESLSGYPKNEI